MKRTAAKAVSLLLVLCLSVFCFAACSQTIVVRFVDKDGEDLVFEPVVNTAVPVSGTPAPAATTVSEQPSASSSAETQPSASTNPAEQTPATEAPATEPPTTEPPATQAPAGFSYQPLNKKGDLYRADCTGKIWAKIVGSCYILFRDIDEQNEWTEKGKVYELHVTYVKVGENYSMWSDGYWELDATGTQLTLTPVNQGENGNIGTQVGSSKTFTGKDGVFEIPVTFEQGGKTTVILDLNKPLE